MTARIDILDQAESLRGAFWKSVFLHAAFIGLIVGLAVVHPFGKVIQIGDPKGGRFGSVAVNAVPTIPLPNRGAQPNPVAVDTSSKIPQAPSKAKPEPKVRTPASNAIPLKGKNAKERKQTATPNKYADQQQYQPNQLYSTKGAAASSPLYNLPGGGGIGLGENSPFGTAYGYYANLLREKIGMKWQSAGLGNSSVPVTIQFDLKRDGSLGSGLPRIVQTSGNAALDRSAQRAILDAAPFPPLPPGLNQNQVTVELSFSLRR